MKKAIVILIILAGVGYGGLHFYKNWQSQQKRTRLAQGPKTAK
jgi:uncharacterized membrane protein YebE (DUF533 family)